ncbi:hypothetical protein ACGYK5_17795 [Sulfitobacter sp. 1A16787]|uniref:hypothetical protein n=1 Tax=Sulfitobacter sp. 1A16787 TaxID=3368571 RepID=UPI003744B5C6
MSKSALDRLRALAWRIADAPAIPDKSPDDIAGYLESNVRMSRACGFSAASLAAVQVEFWLLQRAAGVSDAALANALERTLARDCEAFDLEADGRAKPILPKPHPGDYVGAWDWPEFAGLARLGELMRKPSLRRAAILAAALAVFAAATWGAKLAWLAVLT